MWGQGLVTAVTAVSSFVSSFAEDPLLRNLKNGLKQVQRNARTTKEEKKKAAERHIKNALQRLKEEHRDDFPEARRTGSGRFLEILKTSKEFFDKIVFEETIKQGGVKGCKHTTKDGYPLITYK